ncbi:MAG TPA: isoprenylcysteine carboxylmethyltransferase family protein [Acidimicrobiales bacterium]|jgi:protein-S-isoprenylcysteine O-methyltransferase Ste14|nr:isoprenylcysteine carboxylmethyltransferase family protein [Acidimicrobiales bacterium]
MRKPTLAVASSAFFALAPGIVAGVVPWWLTGWRSGWPAQGAWWAARVPGIALIGLGALVLVHAFVRFVAEGVGTPAPVAPTDRLVVGGLYRHVRNPMYVAVVAVIVGQALLLGRPVLLVYGAAAGAAMAAFARWYEEPALARRFGEPYEVYRNAVPAWWPRWRPYVGEGRWPDRGQGPSKNP